MGNLFAQPPVWPTSVMIMIPMRSFLMEPILRNRRVTVLITWDDLILLLFTGILTTDDGDDAEYG